MQKGITEKIKAKEDAGVLLAQKETLEAAHKTLEREMNDKEVLLFKMVATVGNLVHASVVDSKNEVQSNAIL